MTLSKPSPLMKTLIVQTSPMHTASTLLINAIHGLIPELADKRIITGKRFEPFDILAIKMHNTNIDRLQRLFRDYRVLFVCSERKDLNLFIDPKYKLYSNVIVFDFVELNATEATPLSTVVDTIYNRVAPLLPDIRLDKALCLQRLMAMNKRYEEIKNKPFFYIDPFYELHGSHRNRPAAQSGHK